MALAGKEFYNAFLPAVEAVLYTVPGGKVAYLSFGFLKNMAVTTETPAVRIRSGGVTTDITPGYASGIGQYYSDDFIMKTVTLVAATEIRGVSTNASAVKLVLTGAEE